MADTPLELAFSTVAQRVIPGATLLAHRPLKGGVSAAVHVLDISSPAGLARLVVRRHGAAKWKALASDVTQTEFQLLATLHRAGLPVPRPRLLDDSALLLPSPFFVMDMVDGSTDIAAASLDSALHQMARFLARLHAIDVDVLRLPPLPSREDPVQGALEYLPCGPELAPLREVVASYGVRRARPSLLHGDFWPGNVLWAKAELAAVIDWEDAALGPPVSDVAGCRAELNALFDAAASRSFTDHYLAASGAELCDLPLWDVYVGSAALATLPVWGLPAEEEARRRERTTAFVSHAAEVLLLTQ
ncbi:MAG TPA: phosphotransferase family protein [Polyangiaceae bacterium]|nr:phosphotransferase family protein [Polyangiaceae bacterium]